MSLDRRAPLLAQGLQQSHRPGRRALAFAGLELFRVVAPLLARRRSVALDEIALRCCYEVAAGPAEAPGDDAGGGAA